MHFLYSSPIILFFFLRRLYSNAVLFTLSKKNSFNEYNTSNKEITTRNEAAPYFSTFPPS